MSQCTTTIGLTAHYIPIGGLMQIEDERGSITPQWAGGWAAIIMFAGLVLLVLSCSPRNPLSNFSITLQEKKRGQAINLFEPWF